MYVCCRRINPFDQASGDVVETLEAAKEDPHYIESFIVRFLGSMEVKADRGMVIYPAWHKQDWNVISLLATMYNIMG